MFHWGIMGGGFISSQFAKGIAFTDDMEVQAVASVSGRDPFGIQARAYYDSYENLAEDENIDAVYVGTIHPLHLPCVKLCLEAGKPVLCEKPIAMNARELEEMLALAREKKVFFMEAMWSRYLPAVRYVKELLAEGTYGTPQYMHITFGNCVPESNERIHKAALGGGSLLDVGVYGINLADFWLTHGNSSAENRKETQEDSLCPEQGFFPEVAEMHSWAVKNTEFLDLTTMVQMLYYNGRGKSALVDVTCSVQRNLPNSAYIVTDKGEFSVPYFWRSDRIFGYTPNQGFQTERCFLQKEFPLEGNGYQYEALEVKRCIEAGLMESPDMTWEDSLRIMRRMDAIRRQCGIRYPQDAQIPAGRSSLKK